MGATIVIIVFILAEIYIYVRASANGYNAIRWVIGSIAGFFGIQNIINVIFFLTILFFQSSPEALEKIKNASPIVDVISLLLSSSVLLLIMWQVSQKADDSPNPNAERPL